MVENEINTIELQEYKLCPSCFDNKLNNLNDNSLSITHINIRSLNKNISELQLLYDHSLKFKFDIIALSEVWNVRNTDTLPGITFWRSIAARQMRGVVE